MVGTSGSAGDRFVPVTASAMSFFALKYGMAPANVMNIMST